MSKFVVEVDDFDYGSVEFAICNAYDIGLPSSSDFMELTPNKTKTINIVATKGSGTFSVLAYVNKEGKGYLKDYKSKPHNRIHYKT